MLSALETPGLRGGGSREEPQGGDAEHGLLTHVAGQLLTRLFKDQRLEGQRDTRIPLRESGWPQVWNPPPSPLQDPLTSIFLARRVLGK